MDTKSLNPNPARKKVHIVYYLNRGGQVDPPHLIEGYLHCAQDGLRLKDVKRWLSVLRGRGMPNSFAWSYKRTYKNGYIWHDLSESDFIQPVCKNEYILMGSELQEFLEEKCKCAASRSPTRRKEADEFQHISENIVQCHFSKSIPNQMSELGFENGDDDKLISLTLLHSPSSGDKKIMKKPGSIQTKLTECKFDTDRTTDDSSPRQSDRCVFNEEGVYKARALALSGDLGTDVATQTGESKRCSSEEPLPLQLCGLPPNEFVQTEPTNFQGYNAKIHERKMDLFPPASVPSPVSEATSGKQLKNSNSTSSSGEDVDAAGKTKPSAGSQVLKQILACGSADVDEAGIFNFRTLTLQPATIAPPSPPLQRDMNTHWSCRPCGGPKLSDMSNQCSKDVVASSPDSASLKRVNNSMTPVGSASPGIPSMCSSSPRRSSNGEVRGSTGELVKEYREAMTKTKGGHPESSRRFLQFDVANPKLKQTTHSASEPLQVSGPVISTHSAPIAQHLTATATVERSNLTRSKTANFPDRSKSPGNWREILWSKKIRGEKWDRKDKQRA